MSVSRYVEIRTIGMGSFGRAILVKRKEDNALLVMKEIKIDEMVEQERDDAMNEVLVLKTLQHPNIIAYEESFIEDGVLHIVMEYANGGDLHDVIAKQTKENNSYLPEQVILCWFVQISLALQHVHEKNILHRDLKTQNIFLAEQGATIKLGDFGIAKVLNSNTEFAKTVIGTPYYLSPEICEDQPYDSKSDIWSLGCVLYELVTLRHAFDAQSLPALVLKILKGNYPPIPTIYSQELKSLISSMLQTDPHNRPTIRDILTLPLLINFISSDTKPNLPLSLIQVSPVIKKKQPAKPSPPSSSSKLKKPAAPINKAVAVKSKVNNSSPSSTSTSTSTSKSILPSKNTHTPSPSPKNSPIRNTNSSVTNNNNNNNNVVNNNNNNSNPTTSPLESQKYVPTPRPSSASSSSPYVSSFIKGIGKNPPVSKIAAKKPPSKPSPPLSKKSAVNSPQKINNSPSTHNSNTLTSTNSTQATHSPVSHHLPSFAQKVPDLESLKKREANYKEQLRGVKSRISKNIKPFSQFSNQQNDTDAIVIDSTLTTEKSIDDNNGNSNNNESNNDNPNTSTENVETTQTEQTAQPNETPTPTIKINEQPKTDEKMSTQTEKEKLVTNTPDSTITKSSETTSIPTSKKTPPTTKPSKDNQTKNTKNNNHNNNNNNNSNKKNNKNKNIAVPNSKNAEEKKSSLKDIIKERRKVNNSNGELEVEILVPKYTPPLHVQNNNNSNDSNNDTNETDTQPQNETESQTNTESHIATQPSDTKTDTQQQAQSETQKQNETPNSTLNEILASEIQTTQSNTEPEKQSTQQITPESNIESNNEKSKSGTLNSSLTTSMNSSDREARLSLRIESLRQLCEEYFGIEMFFKVYKYLRDNDEDDNETQKKVKEMVPVELQNRLRFIDQLIYCEIQFYGS